MAYRPLLVVAVAFAAGVCVDRYGGPADSPARAVGWWATAVVCVLAWWGVGIAKFGRPAGLVRAVLLCAGTLAAGAAWHHAGWFLFPSDEIGRFAAGRSEPTCIEAVALESPRNLPALQVSPYRAIPVGERSQLRVVVRAIRKGTEWLPANGLARLTVNGQLLDVQAGDRIDVFAEIVAPRPPQNPGEFDYAAHARAERRLADFRSGFPECVRVLRPGASLRPRRILDRVQTWCLDQLHRQLGPEDGPLAAALVLGVRESITRDEMETYQATGTIHLLVVSGLHVGILASVAFFLARCLLSTRRRALVATACVVILFALLTGGRPSVIRAAVCTLAVLAALGSGRPVGFLNVLAGAALAVMILNPNDLFRVGPQLSFLAALTLIWYGQHRQQKKLAESPLEQVKREARPLLLQWAAGVCVWTVHLVAISFCLWLVSLPLVMSQFHLFTPVAVLLAPVVGVAAWFGLTSGFALLAVQAVAPFASGLAAGLCGLFTGLLRHTVSFAETLPLGHFWVSGPANWWIVGAYSIAACLILTGQRVPVRWKAVIFALWIAIGFLVSLVAPVSRNDSPTLTCTFLSVGHGTCVVLQTPDGRCLLYDAGSLGSPELAASSIASYLWSEGVRTVDGVILSHSDIDHFNAVPDLLDRFGVAGVLVSPVMFDPFTHPNEQSAPRVLQAELAAKGLPVRSVFSGDRLDLGEGVTAEVRHPPREGLIGSDNANSIVLAIEFAGRRILLTGDLESPGMDDVLAELPWNTDVLLAPHHGSRFSDPPGLAEWSTPQWVVISGGDQADSAEAARTYRAAGAKVLHTSQRGAVRFRLTEDGLAVHQWSQGAWKSVRRPDLHDLP